MLANIAYLEQIAQCVAVGTHQFQVSDGSAADFQTTQIAGKLRPSHDDKCWGNVWVAAEVFFSLGFSDSDDVRCWFYVVL